MSKQNFNSAKRLPELLSMMIARSILLCLLLSCTPELSARNFFSPYTNALDADHELVRIEDRFPIHRFDGVEFGFELPAALEQMVEKGEINPFDPDQINVVAEFKSGDKIDTVYGFYYREYIRDQSTIVPVFENCPPAKWIAQETNYKWRIRFAPPTAGDWIVQVKVYVPKKRQAPHVFNPFPFNVRKEPAEQFPQGKGFLQIGNDGLHFSESGEGRSFFAIGQDMGWPDGARFRGGPNPKYPQMRAGGFMDIEDWIRNLGHNGGNMIRVVNVPWSYELEWDTVGEYRMDRAWELDQLLLTCEDADVKVLFCMEHGTYTLPSSYEEHLSWERHPYNRFLPGVDYTDDFLQDSTARAMYKKKLRYFFARWGYSTSLGIFQMLSEMDHWTFRGPDIHPEDNRDAQRMLLNWHNEMLAFAKQQVTYRPLLTSTSYADAPRDFPINAYSSPYVDVIHPRHSYFTNRNDNLRRFGEVNGFNAFERGVHELFPDKPALFDEVGMWTTGADPSDIEANSDVNFHNAIWATSFSGTAGSALYWWNWSRNDYRENNFPALSQFFSTIDFETARLNRPGHWEDAGRPSKVSIETFYLNTENPSRDLCIGWVHNASYWWGNISQNFKDRNGKTMAINSRTGDDVNLSAPAELPKGTKFEVHDLANGETYSLAWYNTRGAGGQSDAEECRTNIFGTAKIAWRAGAADWGYKLERRKPGTKNTSIVLPPDTVVAGEVIPVFGNHPLDSNGMFTYYWDFGNGVESDKRNTSVIYNAGSFKVRLICTDARGKHLEITQDVVVIAPHSTDAASASFFARRIFFY